MDATFEIKTMADVLYFAIWYGGMIIGCVGLIALALGVLHKSINAFSIGLVVLMIGSIPFVKGLQLMRFM